MRFCAAIVRFPILQLLLLLSLIGLPLSHARSGSDLSLDCSRASGLDLSSQTDPIGCRNIRDLLNEVLEAEQVCLVGTRFGDPQQPPAHLRRLSRFLPIVEPLIAEQGWLEPAAPTNWNGDNWSAGSRWFDLVRGVATDPRPAPAEELVEAIYVRAVIRLATLNPTLPPGDHRQTFSPERGIFYSLPLHPNNRLNADQMDFDCAERDRLRALWELRFFNLSPSMISGLSSPSLSHIFSDGAARRNFVNQVEIAGQQRSRRRALGWAFGMCGRSMNAHYLDSLVDAGSRQMPPGWSINAVKPVAAGSDNPGVFLASARIQTNSLGK